MVKAPPPNNKRCTAKTKAGTRCTQGRQPGEDKCFKHSPTKAKESKEASRKGGRNAHKPMQVLDKAAARLAFARSMDVISALEEVFDKVSKGELDYRVGQTLGTLGATMLKGLQYKESDDQDARIADLARRLESMKRAQGNATDKNGQAKGTGQAGEKPACHGGGEDVGAIAPGWLDDDETGGDGSGPMAGGDAAQPLWDPDAD